MAGDMTPGITVPGIHRGTVLTGIVRIIGVTTATAGVAITVDGTRHGTMTGMVRHGVMVGAAVIMAATMAVIMAAMAAIGAIIIITGPITVTSTDEQPSVIRALLPVRVIQVTIAGLPVRVRRRRRGEVRRPIAEVQMCEAAAIARCVAAHPCEAEKLAGRVRPARKLAAGPVRPKTIPIHVLRPHAKGQHEIRVRTVVRRMSVQTEIPMLPNHRMIMFQGRNVQEALHPLIRETVVRRL